MIWQWLTVKEDTSVVPKANAYTSIEIPAPTARPPLAPAYPARTPSTLDFTTKRQPGYWFQPRWQEAWFPDAFAGTMAQLLCALEEDREREISGRDNLETIALCEAVYTAAQEHRVISLSRSP
jgi:predicted dehydrogenase